MTRIATVERPSPAETNPLRVWRQRQKPPMTFMEAADALGVSKTTLREWEVGSLTPKDSNFEKIAELMGLGLPSLRRAWGEWETRKRAAVR